MLGTLEEWLIMYSEQAEWKKSEHAYTKAEALDENRDELDVLALQIDAAVDGAAERLQRITAGDAAVASGWERVRERDVEGANKERMRAAGEYKAGKEDRNTVLGELDDAIRDAAEKKEIEMRMARARRREEEAAMEAKRAAEEEARKKLQERQQKEEERARKEEEEAERRRVEEDKRRKEEEDERQRIEDQMRRAAAEKMTQGLEERNDADEEKARTEEMTVAKLAAQRAAVIAAKKIVTDSDEESSTAQMVRPGDRAQVRSGMRCRTSEPS